jgi:hypothetical protein
MITGWKKSQEMGDQHLQATWTVSRWWTRVGHQHRGRTGTLDKIQDIVLQEEEEEIFPEILNLHDYDMYKRVNRSCRQTTAHLDDSEI